MKNFNYSKAKEIHQDKYDYSKVLYKGSKEKVCIICPEHGEFWQTPDDHINHKRGCPKCKAQRRRLTQQEWIDKASAIHNNRYDYSLVEYSGSLDKVPIICPIHGKFIQRANIHLQGHGCPYCSKSRGEKAVEDYLQKSNIPYECQKAYKCPVNPSGTMQVDFYVNFNDNEYVIEYNGKQHYEYVEYFYGGKIDEFERRQKRDQYLIEFCKSNNIIPIIISYKDNPEEILSRYFS